MSKSPLGRGLNDLLREGQAGPKPGAFGIDDSSEASSLDPGVRALVARSSALDQPSESTTPDSPPPAEAEQSGIEVRRSPALRWTLAFADLLLLAFAAYLMLGQSAGWPEVLLSATAVTVAIICGCYAWLSD